MLENHTPKFVIMKKKKEADREDKSTADNLICFINRLPINTANAIAP